MIGTTATDISSETNRNLKYLCRMMRVWRDKHSVAMSGMLIDTLAYQFIATWPHRDKSFLYHDYMARDFFAYLAGQNTAQTIWRAPGSGSSVSRKGSFEAKARNAHGLALEAIDYDGKGMPWSRNQKWREIFGTLFPC